MPQDDAYLNEDITRTSQGYRDRLPEWAKIRDALEGEGRIKSRGTAYLPRPVGMGKAQYAAYVERASFFAMSERTLRGISGLVFRVNPTVDLPDSIDTLREIATPEGYTLSQLAREATNEALSLGRYGLLVDMGADQELDPTPYLSTYKAEDIFRWEEATYRGRRKLVRVVVREEKETHGHTTFRRIRELALNENGNYVQTLYEEDESETDSQVASNDDYLISGNYRKIGTVVPTKNGVPFKEIPFWFINVFDTRPRPVKPPFLDMVSMNVAHYRNSADYEQSLFMTSQPTPYIFGISPDEVPTGIGAGTIWTSQSRDVHAGFIEFSGPGIESLERALRSKEDRMAAIGARIILDVERADNVTAETTRLQTRAETSVMVGAVNTVEEAFTAALKFAAEWVGASPEKVKFTLNQDFIETRLSPQEITALVAGWQVGAYSKRTLHENLQRGEIIPPDRTLDEEDQLIQDEGGVPGSSRDEDFEEDPSEEDANAASSSDVAPGAGDSGTSEGE